MRHMREVFLYFRIVVCVQIVMKIFMESHIFKLAVSAEN